MDAILNAGVVIEGTNRDAAAAQLAALEQAGFSVTTCGGPDALPGGVCPLVGGDPCPWVDAADVIVHDLSLDKPAYREILQELRRTHPDTPVVLEIPEATARHHASLLEGCHVVYPYDMDRFVQAVTDAFQGSTRREGLPSEQASR